MRLHNISLNNLRRRRAKMIFLVIGLFVGIAAIVMLMAITESMNRNIEAQLDRFGANIVMTPRSEHLALSYGGIVVAGVSAPLTEIAESRLADIHTIKNHSNIGIVAPKVLGSTRIGGRVVLLVGVDLPAELNLKTWWSFKGSYPQHPQELIAGAGAARVLGLQPGTTLPLANGQFTVSAVLKPTGGSEDNTIMGDLHAVQAILGKPGKISLVEIAAFCGGCPISEMVLQIAEKFPDTRVTALQQTVMSKMQSMEIFKSFGYGIAALVIVIGALLIFVSMMGSVNERTREIGIFRAIGFRRGHVMQIFLLEAAVMGLIGGTLGVAGGNLLAWGLLPWISANGSFAGINAATGALAVVLAVALSLSAALYPARKASRMDPSEALRAL